MENRFRMLDKTHPQAAKELGKLAQHDVDLRRELYEYLAARNFNPAKGNL